MASKYLVAPDGHGNFDEHLARFVELERQGELAKIKEKIEVAIDNYIECGQFEEWWKNPRRTNTMHLPHAVMTFFHNDDFLLALLRNYRTNQSSDERVADAWKLLLYKFRCDRENENWRGADWQPSDDRGPHRH